MIYSEEYTIEVVGKREEKRNVSVGVYKLKTAAQELYPLLRKPVGKDYVMAFAESFFNSNAGECCVNIHEVNEIREGDINYQLDSLKSWE